MGGQEQSLKGKFSSHRFILSPVGILKIVGIILFLVGSIISLSNQVCSSYGKWLELTFPILTVVNGVLIVILYVAVIVGLARRIPVIWVKIEISCSTISATITLVLSILVLANCSSNDALSVIPGVFGIVGSLLLLITAATLFVTWKNTEDTVDEVPASHEPIDLKRKSVFI